MNFRPFTVRLNPVVVLSGLSLLFCAAAVPSVRANTSVVLYSFTDIAEPVGTLTPSPDGAVLYGVTSAGGANFRGTLFKINPDGTGYHDLHDFSSDPTNGSTPTSGIVLSVDGNTIYGTTLFGGPNVTGGDTDGPGIIYSIGTDGSNFQILHSFTDLSATDGSKPQAGLIRSGTTLYGTTKTGGTTNVNTSLGTVFSISTTGNNFTILHRFQPGAGDGTTPYAGVILVGATLYGTAEQGGTDGNGAIYQIDTNGSNYTVIHSFNADSSEGAYPDGGVIYANGMLYGTTEGRGAGAGNNSGSVYSFDLGGATLSVLHTFASDGSEGKNSTSAPLLLGSTLYVNTDASTPGFGMLVQVNTDGTGFKPLHTYTGATSDGSAPRGSILAPDGTWLLTLTNGGGANSGGAVVTYSLLPDPTPAPAAPTVSVTGKKKITTTAAKLKIKGTASGTAVKVSVKVGKTLATASGTTSWSYTAKLKSGSNKIVVQAVGATGLTSAPVSITVIRK